MSHFTFRLYEILLQELKVCVQDINLSGILSFENEVTFEGYVTTRVHNKEESV